MECTCIPRTSPPSVENLVECTWNARAFHVGRHLAAKIIIIILLFILCVINFSCLLLFSCGYCVPAINSKLLTHYTLFMGAKGNDESYCIVQFEKGGTVGIVLQEWLDSETADGDSEKL